MNFDRKECEELAEAIRMVYKTLGDAYYLSNIDTFLLDMIEDEGFLPLVSDQTVVGISLTYTTLEDGEGLPQIAHGIFHDNSTIFAPLLVDWSVDQTLAMAINTFLHRISLEVDPEGGTIFSEMAVVVVPVSFAMQMVSHLMPAVHQIAVAANQATHGFMHKTGAFSGGIEAGHDTADTMESLFDDIASLLGRSKEN